MEQETQALLKGVWCSNAFSFMKRKGVSSPKENLFSTYSRQFAQIFNL